MNGDSLKEVKTVHPQSEKGATLPLLVIILLIIGIFVGVKLIDVPQLLRSRASSDQIKFLSNNTSQRDGKTYLLSNKAEVEVNYTPESQFLSNQCQNPPLEVPVLALAYFPRDPQKPMFLDQEETGWEASQPIEDWEADTQVMMDKLLSFASDATKFHGYKDPNAVPFLNFKIIDYKKFYTPIPRGLQNSPTTHLPNYAQIMKDVGICDLVDNQGVKEVWMYGYHSDKIVPDESRMSSRYGDVSNSLPKEETLPDDLKLPVCSKAYTLYNFTYQPGARFIADGGIGNNVHNRIHQIENTIPFIEEKWPPNPPFNTSAESSSIYWGDFSEYLQRDPKQVNPDGSRAAGYKSSCGNAHIGPNWGFARQEEYGYSSPAKYYTSFNCESWHPDDSKTTYINAGCERWGCTELGFYKWFMQNMPGYQNGIEYKGQKMRNWWEAIYDFDSFVEGGRSLYGGSIVPNLCGVEGMVTFRVDESLEALSSAPFRQYSPENKKFEHIFKDGSPGTKVLYVQFKGTDGKLTSPAQASIILQPDENISEFASCNNNNLASLRWPAVEGATNYTIRINKHPETWEPEYTGTDILTPSFGDRAFEAGENTSVSVQLSAGSYSGWTITPSVNNQIRADLEIKREGFQCSGGGGGGSSGG